MIARIEMDYNMDFQNVAVGQFSPYSSLTRNSEILQKILSQYKIPSRKLLSIV